ncbi:MAG TPA: NrfD/PsrC family molybdoenzyme membrane anchor subunit [Pseudolabrys sp.]|nr:NrfD/PsrC family molybdoenzyme membrane anchor subunit [Pseudolabrys sp.]
MSIGTQNGDLQRWMLLPARSYDAINEAASGPLIQRQAWRWRAWWIAFLAAGVLTVMMIAGIVWPFFRGVGVWGNNTTVVWGFPLANYEWWIGIGNAGLLISAILVLTRQPAAAAIQRIAESMALLSACVAGLFPILHLGRPQYAYWLIPYPNTMMVWPQWRSALIWDFWSILSFILFTAIYFYVGLIPDLATLRDRASNIVARLFYGVLAMGWRGSARHWRIHSAYRMTMAGLAVPLVVVAHSVVGLDFAASLMPGWQETIFPTYYVIGALVLGSATLLIVMAVARWGLRLSDLITPDHFNLVAKFLLAASIGMGLCYCTEYFAAWYHGERAERWLVAYEFTGAYAPMYWTMLLLIVVLPQALWFEPLRRNIAAVLAIAVLADIGMWIERIIIIWLTLSHGYIVSMWRLFIPTAWDWALLIGSFGFFLLMFLLLARVLPLLAMDSLKRLLTDEAPR